MSGGRPARDGDRFEGLHAIITGGSSGIGLATARALGVRGSRVSLLARGEDRLRVAAQQLAATGVQVATTAADVSDPVAVGEGIESMVARQGPCDILVTSAGTVHPGHFPAIDRDTFRQEMDVNYFGTLYAIQAVIPSMIERKQGTIVGVSSAAGLMGVYGYTTYAPTKFAVRGLLESLRAEMVPHNVSVRCVFPADIDTPGLQTENLTKPAETSAATGSIRVRPPEVVADAIIAGIAGRRFAIYSDAQTRMLARWVSLIEGLLNRTLDKRISKIRAS